MDIERETGESELRSFESPVQYTACRAPGSGLALVGQMCRRECPVLGLTAAANKDSHRYEHPDQIDLSR